MAETPMRAELASLWRKPKTAYRRLKAREVTASHNPEVVKRLAAFAFRRRDSINAIVITGDIATTGSPEDLTSGYKLIADKPDHIPYLNVDGDGTLNLSDDLPIVILPGNHDRYMPTTRKHSLIPGGRHFHQVFSAWWTDDVHAHVVELGNSRLGLFAADFSLRSLKDASFPTFWNKWAQGKVYPDVLQRLEGITLQFMLDGKFAGKRSVPVWAVHYPPNYDYGNKRRTTEHRLNGEEDLVAAARRCEVPLILAGHSHKHRYYPNGIVTPFTFCAGTSSQVGPAVPGNYCHIISFDIDDSDYQYSVKHFRFDPIAGDFQYVDEEGDSQM